MKTMRCKHITVTTADKDYDYDVDAPSWQPKTLHELLTQHPSLTKIVVTFIPIEKKAVQ